MWRYVLLFIQILGFLRDILRDGFLFNSFLRSHHFFGIHFHRLFWYRLLFFNLFWILLCNFWLSFNFRGYDYFNLSRLCRYCFFYNCCRCCDLLKLRFWCWVSLLRYWFYFFFLGNRFNNFLNLFRSSLDILLLYYRLYFNFFFLRGLLDLFNKFLNVHSLNLLR